MHSRRRTGRRPAIRRACLWCLGGMLLAPWHAAAQHPARGRAAADSNWSRITGRIAYRDTALPVAGVNLQLSGDSAAARTDTAGAFALTLLTGATNLMLRPEKSGDLSSLTITSFDAALAARLAAGLDTPAALDAVAADVDEDGRILPLDAALICRRAIDLLPFSDKDHTGAWRFDPAARTYALLQNDQAGQDFAAFLLGDIDGSWAPGTVTEAGAATSAGSISLPGNGDFQMQDGLLLVPLLYDGAGEAFAFDIEITYPPAVVRFVEAENLVAGLEMQTNGFEQGRLRIGLYGPEPLRASRQILRSKWELLQPDSTYGFRLEQALINGRPQRPIATGISVGNKIPDNFILHQNFPNPFNPVTVIRFGIPASAGTTVYTEVRVLNIRGQLIRTLLAKNLPPGMYAVPWDGKNNGGSPVSSGIYLYSMRTNHQQSTRKMILQK